MRFSSSSWTVHCKREVGEVSHFVWNVWKRVMLFDASYCDFCFTTQCVRARMYWSVRSSLEAQPAERCFFFHVWKKDMVLSMICTSLFRQVVNGPCFPHTAVSDGQLWEIKHYRDKLRDYYPTRKRTRAWAAKSNWAAAFASSLSRELELAKLASSYSADSTN